jgi:ribosomal protein L37AE/L43A
MRLSHLGKPSGRKGIATSPEAIAKLKATFEANRWTCPHCNKVGLNKGSGNRWHFDNCKEKTWQAQ